MSERGIGSRECGDTGHTPRLHRAAGILQSITEPKISYKWTLMDNTDSSWPLIRGTQSAVTVPRAHLGVPRSPRWMSSGWPRLVPVSGSLLQDRLAVSQVRGLWLSLGD